MDIIQLQCGHCKKVMAISKAHLGQQVQCPHCKAVVQTPPPSPAPAPPPPPAVRDVDMTQSESSAAPPERLDATDFTEPTPTPTPEPASSPSAESFTSAASHASEPEVDFAQFKPKPRADRSVYLLMALIFLVPYSFTITGFLAFLLWRGQSGAPADPLQYLRDPVPAKEKGGPRRVQAPHDSPLAASRMATLRQPVKVGDLVVTPQRVVLTSEGDLKLLLRARNVSANIAFEPISDFYVNANARTETMPFTFLESRDSKDRLYGAFLSYFKNREADGTPIDSGLIGPKEEITIALMTTFKYRDTEVAAIAKSKGSEYTWRVQVRRGFVKVDNKDVSATTVIGVDFTSADIEREGKS
jgi:phage FluMu protein Com